MHNRYLFGGEPEIPCKSVARNVTSNVAQHLVQVLVIHMEYAFFFDIPVSREIMSPFVPLIPSSFILWSRQVEVVSHPVFGTEHTRGH